MTPISLCIITKNEAHYLDRCLDCVKSYPFEIVVVDTGSTDNTLEIAQKYTDCVYTFEWINDFAAARNYAVSKATNDWILFLDTDEFVYELHLDGLYEFTKKYPKGIGTLLLTSEDAEHATTIERLDRFFNRRFYHYERPIHEQIRPYDKATKIATYPIPVCAKHVGYSGTKEALVEKAKRNLSLLLASEKEYPDPYTYYQIGQCYYTMSDWQNACKYFERGLSYDLNPHLEYVQMMVVNYGYCLNHLERPNHAISFLEPLYPSFDTYADYVFLMGYLYMETKNYMKAVLNFIKATTLSDFKVEGTNSYRAFYNLGALYEMMGDKELALKFYEKCGTYPPAVQQSEKLRK